LRFFLAIRSSIFHAGADNWPASRRLPLSGSAQLREV